MTTAQAPARTPPPGDRPFELAPLAAALRIPLDQPHMLAYRLGCTPRHVNNLRRHGLNEEQADKYACAANLHPALVWPEWLIDVEDQGDDTYDDLELDEGGELGAELTAALELIEELRAAGEPVNIAEIWPARRGRRRQVA